MKSRAISIVGAKDLTQEEYDEISKRKKMAKTTTDDNLQADKHYWQNYFLTNELDEAVLNNFFFGTNLLQNYVGLIDVRNHDAEDNLKSEKQLQTSRSSGRCWRGWDGTNARDEDAIRKEKGKRRFANNVVA
ncbi:MAG: hypothetical protein ACKPKO_04595, partial [Candidatus Fonsibacter sp.]